MAILTIDDEGNPVVATALTLPAGAVTTANPDEIQVINDTDATVRGEVIPSAGVNLNGLGAGVSASVTIQPESVLIYTMTKTAAAGSVTADIYTSHGTGAQDGELMLILHNNLQTTAGRVLTTLTLDDTGVAPTTDDAEGNPMVATFTEVTNPALLPMVGETAEYTITNTATAAVDVSYHFDYEEVGAVAVPGPWTIAEAPGNMVPGEPQPGDIPEITTTTAFTSTENTVIATPGIGGSAWAPGIMVPAASRSNRPRGAKNPTLTDLTLLAFEYNDGANDRNRVIMREWDPIANAPATMASLAGLAVGDFFTLSGAANPIFNCNYIVAAGTPFDSGGNIYREYHPTLGTELTDPTIHGLTAALGDFGTGPANGEYNIEDTGFVIDSVQNFQGGIVRVRGDSSGDLGVGDIVRQDDPNQNRRILWSAVGPGVYDPSAAQTGAGAGDFGITSYHVRDSRTADDVNGTSVKFAINNRLFKIPATRNTAYGTAGAVASEIVTGDRRNANNGPTELIPNDWVSETPSGGPYYRISDSSAGSRVVFANDPGIDFPNIFPPGATYYKLEPMPITGSWDRTTGTTSPLVADRGTPLDLGGTGTVMFGEASVVSLTRLGTPIPNVPRPDGNFYYDVTTGATTPMIGHGLVTGDTVDLAGFTPTDYNAQFNIVSDADGDGINEISVSSFRIGIAQGAAAVIADGSGGTVTTVGGGDMFRFPAVGSYVDRVEGTSFVDAEDLTIPSVTVGGDPVVLMSSSITIDSIETVRRSPGQEGSGVSFTRTS